MLILQNVSYLHSNKDLLFDAVNLSVADRAKIALIGNNGSGKSTLLKIISRELQPAGGQVKVDTVPYVVPQVLGQYNDLSIAQALQVDRKLDALRAILNGDVTEGNLDQLNDDWTIEERCNDAMKQWQLDNLDLFQKMETLSGGQKTKVFLAGITLHRPALILLDEPSNHLDVAGRQQLYDFIQSSSCAMVVVSHDRKLLNLLDTVCELDKGGLTLYGGNYDFYEKQKQIEQNALNQDIRSKEKLLRKAREKERETLERKQKLDARGKKKQQKAGVARIMMNTLRNNAETSSSRISGMHTEKISGLSDELRELRSDLPSMDKMKFDFDNGSLHKGKTILSITGVNFRYHEQFLWKENLDLQVASGERIALKGPNGSGKTTLMRLMLGSLEPLKGKVYRSINKSIYIDQDYSLIDDQLNVYDQAQRFNTMTLQEHDVKIRLTRFLFTKEDWHKPCGVLSGGERMRLMLCCLNIQSKAPDMMLLDEPTNNLDIHNIAILTNALREYSGTMIVISHDEYFLEQIGIARTIQLP